MIPFRGYFRYRASLTVVVAVFGLLLGMPGGPTQGVAQIQAPIKDRYVEGEVLVKFNPGLSRGEIEAVFARHGMTILRAYRAMPQLFHVRLPAGLTVEAAITLLTADAGVESAEPNYLVELQSACPVPCSPNDPQYPNQWGLTNIQAEGAWPITHGSSSAIVAILDTGLDRTHLDLQDNAWTNPADPINGIDDDGDGYTDDYYGYNATADLCLIVPCPAGDPLDDDTSLNGHGTRLAGIMGAVGNNGQDMAGVSWHLRILPVKIRYEPNRQSSLDLILAGFDYVVAKKTLGVPIAIAHVSALVSSYSLALQAGIDAMRNAGVLIIWSAGNDAVNVDSVSTDFRRPYDNVVFVGAIDPSNQLASFSSYGQLGVNLAAPGVDILSIVRTGFNPPYPADTGTSYSTPFVTGVAALLSGWDPTLTYTQLKARIISATTSTASLAGKTSSGGRLNAAGIFAAPITDLTPAGYQLARISTGQRYYVDRTFTVSSIPSELGGLWWVRTKNADKARTAADFVTIGLNQPSTVYVAYDPRALAVPDWLSPAQGWIETSQSIGVTGDPVGTLRVYARAFGSAGSVTLGGNQAAGYVPPASGESSNYVVLISPSSNTPPSTPTNLQATAVSPSAISLSWDASFDDLGVDGYTVYRGGVPIATTTTNTYTDTGLVPETLYTYTVDAFDTVGNVSAQSAPASATTLPDVTPPSVPTDLSAVTSSLDEISLTWTASVDDVVVAGYEIYRDGVLLITTANTSYTDTGLDPATPYTYTVRAFDLVPNVSAHSSPASASTPASPTIAALRTGVVSIPAGSASVSVTIQAVDPAKAFLVFGTSFSDANPGFSQISGQIIGPTTLRFQRATGTGAPAVTIKWYVASFADGVSVQRGSATMNATSNNVALAPVDPTRSVPIISYRVSGGSYTGDDFVRAKITSGNNLQLAIDTAMSSAVVEWQVIQFAVAKVQSGDASFTAVDAIKTAAITTVNPAKSWLIYSYQSQAGTTANIGQKLVRGVITDPTTLTFDRGQTGQAIDLTWYLVEFTDDTAVVHGTESFGAAETQRDVTITSVDLTRTLATAGYFMRGGKTTYSANDNPGVGWVTTNLTSETTLQIRRGTTGSATADVGWFVVSFPQPPAAPTGLSANDVPGDEGGSVDLTWTPSVAAGITQQRLYRSTTSGGPYSLVTKFPDNTTNAFTDTGLASGTTYFYVVRAFNGSRESVNSNQASATSVDNIPPGAPAGLGATDQPGDNGGVVNLGWTPSSSTDVAQQRVYRSVTSGGPYNLVTTVDNNTATSYTDAGLSNGTTYYYVIRAFDGTQESANSNQVWVVPVDNLVPTPPTGAGAVDQSGDNGGAINVTWTPSASPDVIEQRIYRSLTSGGPYTLASTLSGAAASAVDAGLVNGTAYFYVLRAYDGTYESANSNEASSVPLDDAAPVISGVASVAAGTQATITWETDEAADSQIEYGTTTAYGSSTPEDLALVTSHSVTVTGLSADTVYHFRIKSRDAAGNQAISGDLTFRTYCLPTQHCVQAGSVTLAAGSAAVTATIAPVDLARTFLVFGISFNDGNPGFSQVSGRIINSSTISFQRATGASAPPVTIKWHVTEFVSGVSVQRGSTAMDATIKNVALSAIDPTKSVPIISYRAPGGSYTGDDFVKAKITGASNLELAVDTSNVSGVVEWQVIQFNGAQVRTGDISFSTTQGSRTASIPTVRPEKSWLVYSYTSQAGTTANIGQKLVRGIISNSTTLTFDRNQTGQAINLTWYLIEFTDATQTRRSSVNFSTSTTQRDVTISSVDRSKSVTAAGYMMRGGRTTYSANDNPGTGWVTTELTSSTNLRVIRGVAGNSSADIGWFVVSFVAPNVPTALSAVDRPGDEGGGVNLAWVVSDSAYAVEQRVYRSLTSGGPYTLVTTLVGNAATSYTDTIGLANGTTYFYVIRAFDGTQESADSNEASAAPVDNLVPVAPTGLTVVDTPGDSGGALDLAWTPSTAPDVSEQRVYRSLTVGGPYTLVATLAGNAAGSHTDTIGLVNGTTYFYVIRAFDGTQESGESNEASAAPVDNTIVAAPRERYDVAMYVPGKAMEVTVAAGRDHG